MDSGDCWCTGTLSDPSSSSNPSRASHSPSARPRRRRRLISSRHLVFGLSIAQLASPTSGQTTMNPLTADPSMIAFSLAPSTSTFFAVPSPPSGSPLTTYITLNVCAAPSSNLTAPGAELAYDLVDLLFVSNSSARTQPGPNSRPPLSGRQGGSRTGHGGFANYTLTNTQGLWIGINAPPAPGSSSSDNVWGFQVGVSSSAPLHSVNAFPAFRFEDSDDTSVLLTGADSSLYIDSAQTAPPPLSAAYPIVAPTTPLLPFGLSSSLCALQTVLNASSSSLSSSVIPTANVSVSLTTRNLGIGRPSSQTTADDNFRLAPQETGQRPQYVVQGLTGGKNYTAWLFQPGGQVNGVQLGRLWPSVNFLTKSTTSCQLVYDLDFCPSVAYSVPSPSSLPLPALVDYYSSLVVPHIQNFSLTMSTYPCNNASVDGRWSYIATCDDCVSAYRDWACGVIMPRCTDVPPFGADVSNDAEVTGRAAGDDKTSTVKSDDEGPGDYGGLIPFVPQTVLTRSNATLSRTPGLAADSLSEAFPSLPPSTVGSSPFPYGEVPPCISTCHLVAASCPPFFGWSCPLLSTTLTASYGLPQADLGGRDVRGGEENSAGGGGERAADRFGNVWCNALGTDMAYARMGAATSVKALGRGATAVAFAVAWVVWFV